MDNKVGDNVPKQKKLDDLLARIQADVDELRTFCINLSDDERTRLLHPRRGAEEKVEKAYDLATRYGVTIKGVPAEGMINDLRLARQIRPFVAALQAASALVNDTAAEAQSEYWQAFLALYGALSKAAAHDPALATELKDLEEFMSVHGRRKKAAAEAPAPDKK